MRTKPRPMYHHWLGLTTQQSVSFQAEHLREGAFLANATRDWPALGSRRNVATAMERFSMVCRGVVKSMDVSLYQANLARSVATLRDPRHPVLGWQLSQKAFPLLVHYTYH